METSDPIVEEAVIAPGVDRDWLTLAGAAVGMMVSVGAILSYTFGVFIGPLQKEFGWSRGQISGSFSVAQISILLSTLLWGGLLDRFGPRRVLLPSVVGLGIGLLLFSQLKAPLWHLYFIFAILPVLGTGTSPIGYNGVLVRRFSRRLGLALGISLMGVGVGAAILPSLTQRFIAALGWRWAYVALAATAVVVGFPAAWIATRNVRGPVRRESGSLTISLLPLVRTQAFMLICGVFFLLGTVHTGVFTQFVPMMTDRGMTPAAAARIVGLVGLSTLVSRGFIGWLLDRIHAPYLLAAVALISGGACLLLLNRGSAGLYSFVAVLLGLIGGAEIDFIGFLVRKYFGAAGFGRLFAVAYAAYAIGPGPLVIGFTFDHFHSYRTALVIFAGSSLLAGLLAFAMPAYEQNDAAFTP